MELESEEFMEHVKQIKEVRMKELFAIIKSSGKCNLLEKFGVAVLYNQMIEKNLKDLIIISNKRNSITDNCDLDKLTFGPLISKFDECVIKLEGYPELKSLLDSCRHSRNVLIHKIFEIEYFFDIVEILEEYIQDEENVIRTLELYSIKLRI